MRWVRTQLRAGRLSTAAFAASRGVGIPALLLLALALPLVPVEASDGREAAVPASYQLLANPSLEDYDPAYARFAGADCQVATGWQRFWHDGPEPYWMDTRVFADSRLGSGWVERIKGETSQLIVGTKPYTAGLLQRVTGLTPGMGYGFHAAMLTIYQTSAPPAVDGTMIKQVGIDPTGGTDPQAPTVVWSEPDDHDEGPWDVERRTAVFGESTAMTVFIRVISPYGSGGLPYLNYSFLDSAILAQTPAVSATSPAVSPEPAFSVRWDNVVPAPDGGKLKGYDVQWLDETEGVWHDWQTRTYEVEATFAGERGHTYRFRARAWQRYPNGAHLYGPYRPQGDTATWVAGPRLVGRVLDSEEHPVAGATVAISGISYAAATDLTGRYVLDVPPLPAPRAVTVQHPWLLSPPPVYGVTLGLTETRAITWTLLPPDDAVANGGFEQELAGWSPLTAAGGTPVVVADPVHTGHAALALGVAPAVDSQGEASPETTVGVSQTVVLAGAWEPALSFWYRQAAVGDEGQQPLASAAAFNVLLTVVIPGSGASPPLTTTRVFTPDLSADQWQHVWYYPYQPHAALTGTVSIQFRLSDPSATAVYLDEVSLGSTPGGPHGVYLSLLLRRH
jgi:hypothetical protein